MNTIQSQIYHFAKSLILDYGHFNDDAYHLDIEDLHPDTTAEFAALLIELDNRDVGDLYLEPSTTMMNIKNDGITCALLSMLNKNNDEEKINFADKLRDNVINCFANRMQSIIDEQCSEMRIDEQAEHGYYPHINRNSGEREWRRV